MLSVKCARNYLIPTYYGITACHHVICVSKKDILLESLHTIWTEIFQNLKIVWIHSWNSNYHHPLYSSILRFCQLPIIWALSKRCRSMLRIQLFIGVILQLWLQLADWLMSVFCYWSHMFIRLLHKSNLLSTNHCDSQNVKSLLPELCEIFIGTCCDGIIKNFVSSFLTLYNYSYYIINYVLL